MYFHHNSICLCHRDDALGGKGSREWNSTKFLLNSYKCILAVSPIYLKRDFFSALCLHIYISHGKPLTTCRDKGQQGWDPHRFRHSSTQHQKLPPLADEPGQDFLAQSPRVGDEGSSTAIWSTVPGINATSITSHRRNNIRKRPRNTTGLTKQ